MRVPYFGMCADKTGATEWFNDNELSLDDIYRGNIWHNIGVEESKNKARNTNDQFNFKTPVNSNSSTNINSSKHPYLISLVTSSITVMKSKLSNGLSTDLWCTPSEMSNSCQYSCYCLISTSRVNIQSHNCCYNLLIYPSNESVSLFDVGSFFKTLVCWFQFLGYYSLLYIIVMYVNMNGRKRVVWHVA